MTSFFPTAREQLIEDIFQPQPQSMPQSMTMAGAPPLLGRTGNFMDQFARIQNQRAQEQASMQAAQMIGSLAPLDPQYDEKVQAIQTQFPMVFGTQPVQSALRRSLQARESGRKQTEESTQQQSTVNAIKEIDALDPTDADLETKLTDIQGRFPNVLSSSPVQSAIRRTLAKRDVEMKKAESQAKADTLRFINKATPEQLATLANEQPEIASVFNKEIERRSQALAEADSLIKSLPLAVAETVDRTDPIAVKKAVEEFKRRVPLPLAKIKESPDQMALAVDYAKQIQALRQKGDQMEDADFAAETSLMEELETITGVKRPNVEVIAKAGSLLERPYSEFDPRDGKGGIKPEFQVAIDSILRSLQQGKTQP